MGDKVLFVATDGLDVRFLDWLDHPDWRHMRQHSAICEVPKPEGIEEGTTATASSPRLWAQMYTGVPPEENRIYGFWEKGDGDGNVIRAKVDWQWVRQNRCEKLVDYTDLGVPPIWELALDAGKQVGIGTAWFTWPLTATIKDLITDTDSWVLTDFPYPMEHPNMQQDGFYWPDEDALHPGDDFTEEAGSGGRVQILKHQDPVGYYDMLIRQDADRYDYMLGQLEDRGTPELGMMMTRSVDGVQHQYRATEDLQAVPDTVADGLENMRRIYTLNLEGVVRLWETGDWDHLVWCSDHGTSLTVDDTGDIAHMSGPDHDWPAYCIWFSDRHEVPTTDKTQGSYFDVPATVLDLLGVDRPDWYHGRPILDMAATADRLEKLGYF